MIMDISLLQNRAMEIREKYRKLEIVTAGKEWTDAELVRGFLTDVTDLLDLVEHSADQEKIGHELSDCLWSVLVLAVRLHIDLPDVFMKNMDMLEKRINDQSLPQQEQR